MTLRDRPWPDNTANLPDSVIGFLQFVQVRAERLLTDVLQESARHLGHLDILRELIDGARGE